MIPMSKQTVVALFETRADAQTAVDGLVDAGIDRGAIRIMPDAEAATSAGPSDEAAYDHDKDESGFWASLERLSVPEEDRHAYAEGMSRGGVTVAVTTDEAGFERVPDIFERAGAVDIDECETTRQRGAWADHTSSKGAGSTSFTRTSGNSAAYAVRGSTERGGGEGCAKEGR